MDNKYEFPEGFLWGTATSAHQVEGGDQNDWSQWEHANSARLAAQAASRYANAPMRISNRPSPQDEENYISGRACDHYNRYEEDFDLAKNLNQNAHRFSIEWSRIEPEEGKFDEKEILHYRKVLLALKDRGLKTMITLHHFTSPIWFANKGGFTSGKAVFYFTRYAKRLFEEYKDLVDFWVSFNEPWNLIANGYIWGNWPPKKHNPHLAVKMLRNIIKAHKEVYDIAHSFNDNIKCGLVDAHNYYTTFNKDSFLDKALVNTAKFIFNDFIFRAIKDKLDFIGLNYYRHYRLSFNILKIFSQDGLVQNENKEVSDFGWEIYPEGIYYVLKDLKKYQKPIYITENGLADAKDEKRAQFIRSHLKWVHKAIKGGVDVRGYFHWSLIDNFEWQDGFWPRFGLIEIDYKTLERKIRPSAYVYAKICKENRIPNS